jgi:hypothetical protein
MWYRFVLFALGSLTLAFAADDGWAKVKALSSGTELRIVKTGSRTPILANLDEATDESLIIATKTEQISIPKDKIEKIEFRAKQASSRIKSENTVHNNPIDKDAARPTAGATRTPGPSGSASSNVSIGGKGDFQVVWTRLARPN